MKKNLRIARHYLLLINVIGVLAMLMRPPFLGGETVTVRHHEGLAHGFLHLRTLEGELLADGDLIQNAHGDRVTTRMVLHFKDGSIHDETAVFTQRGTFHLLSDHLIQKGPSFPHPMDVSTDTSKGDVAVRTTDKDGKEDLRNETLDLPADLANGMVTILLKNLPPGTQSTTLSMVAATPKPRIVKLAIHSQGEETFSTGLIKRKATHYVVKIEIGGVAGLVAPLAGKQPANTDVWILGGNAPAFIKSEGPLFEGGPVWRIELVAPRLPR